MRRENDLPTKKPAGSTDNPSKRVPARSKTTLTLLSVRLACSGEFRLARKL